MGPMMEEGRQARERRYGAQGDARIEREAIHAQLEADRRVRQLQEEHRIRPGASTRCWNRRDPAEEQGTTDNGAPAPGAGSWPIP
jgi:hypothetical protein